MLATTPTLASSVEEAQRHPLWEKQVELELAMMQAGGDRVVDRLRAARERRQMTRLEPVRGLMTDWLPKVGEHIKEWCRVVERQSGPKPIALPLIKALDPYVGALITLRTLLDGLTIGHPSVTGLAIQIGREVEHEQKVRLWEQKEPKLFKATQKFLENTEATAFHRTQVNIHTFNALMAKGEFGFGWQTWSQEDHFRVGVELLNATLRATSWFHYEEDPDFTRRKGQKAGPRLTVVPSPGLVKWLGDALEHAEVNSPAYAPTVIPPRRWEGTRNGGYWTPYVRTPRLIRFKANQDDQKDRAADDYDALDMPQVYDAIHFLQEVPWRVNQRVFQVMEQVVARDLRLGGVPNLSLEGFPLPDRLPGMPEAGDRKAWAEWMKENPKEGKTWKRRAAEVYRRNIKLVSTRKAFTNTFGVAKRYSEFPQFYFPHMMDFRGRMYPIPVGLQPQGDDTARGLLEFAEGKLVTEENSGGWWLALNVASAWGNDKVSFDDRVQWVLDNEAMWERIAADPLGNTEWSTTKGTKPWQTLAAIFDWVGYLNSGGEYVSHAPVPVDGTCNGIQHLSAMLKDEVAGAYVNLVPGEKPRDIYKFVAVGLQEIVERIRAAGGEVGELAQYWLDITGDEFPRSLTKRQVMVLPYGASKSAFFEYTRAWLDEEDAVPDFVQDLPDEERRAWFAIRTQRIVFLANHLWDIVHERVKGAMKVMGWLQECAGHATGSNQPIFWRVPTGFIVRHFYGKTKERQVRVTLSGLSAQLTLQSPTAELSKQEQLRGIPPNFVHSQDAACLTLSVNKAHAEGITAFTSVHDAYGTHAADMDKLSAILREAFVEVHEAEPLVQFRNACMAVLKGILMEKEGLSDEEAWFKADETLPPLPLFGALDVRQVLESPYFFA